MKFVTNLTATWLLLALLATPAISNAKSPGTAGEDPFPLQCVDFTGLWKSDAGTKYKITQTNCKQLNIRMSWNNYTEETVSIVPDNKARAIPGMERSAIRHRWNSNRLGSVIESHRTWVEGVNKITEVVMYERAGANLLLETVYTTVECLTSPGQVTRDYEQQVFRRMSVKPEGEPTIRRSKR